MFSVTVRDHMMIAHSFPGEVFGPAQRLHGATYVVDAAFRRAALDEDGIVVDIGRAAAAAARGARRAELPQPGREPALAGTQHHDRGAGPRGRRPAGRPDRARARSAPRRAGSPALRVTLHESHVAWASYERRAVSTAVPRASCPGRASATRPGRAAATSTTGGSATLGDRGWTVPSTRCPAAPGRVPRRPRWHAAGCSRRSRTAPSWSSTGWSPRPRRRSSCPVAPRLRLVVLVHIRSATARRVAAPEPGPGAAVLAAARAVVATSAWTRDRLLDRTRCPRRGARRRAGRRPGAGRARHARRRAAAVRRRGRPAQGPRRAARGAGRGRRPALALRCVGRSTATRLVAALRRAAVPAGLADRVEFTGAAGRRRRSTRRTPARTCWCCPPARRPTAWSSPRRWPGAAGPRRRRRRRARGARRAHRTGGGRASWCRRTTPRPWPAALAPLARPSRGCATRAARGRAAAHRPAGLAATAARRRGRTVADSVAGGRGGLGEEEPAWSWAGARWGREPGPRRLVWRLGRAVPGGPPAVPDLGCGTAR